MNIGEPRRTIYIEPIEEPPPAEEPIPIAEFTHSSLPSYDAGATALVVERSREFLDRLS
jgi:hypothetical protein